MKNRLLPDAFLPDAFAAHVARVHQPGSCARETAIDLALDFAKRGIIARASEAEVRRMTPLVAARLQIVRRARDPDRLQ